MNGTRHRRRSSVPIGRGWYHSGTTSTNRSLVSLLSLGRLRIKIRPGHLLFRLLFLLLLPLSLPSPSLPFPSSPSFLPPFLSFGPDVRPSLPPSLRPSIITDQTIRGGSVAKVCFAHTTSFVFLFDFFFFDRGNVGRLTRDCPLIAFFELAGKNYANAYAYTRSSLGSKKIKSFERLHGT